MDHIPDVLIVVIELVIVQLVIHKKHDEHKAADSDGKTADIQQGDQDMFPDVAKGDFKVVFYHGIEGFYFLCNPCATSY